MQVRGLSALAPASVVSTGMLFWACAVLMVCCLLLAGGTRVGFLADSFIQLLAIPVLLVSLSRLLDLPFSKQPRQALIFCLAIVLIPLLQLIPLPPGIWTALPNREPMGGAFDLLERELPWMPISVSPHATWLSALSLLPPLAIFFGTLSLGYRERRLLSLVVLALGVLSVFVGLSQVAQGPKSQLRFFEHTNPTEAIGFFANRNHFAALLYALTLLAAAWAVEAAIASEAGRKRQEAGWIVAPVASFTVLVLLVAAQAMARSRAGLGLTIVALFGAFALAVSDRRSKSGVTPGKLLLGATAFAVILALQYGLYRILERLSEDPLEDGRLVFGRITIEAAKAYMPFGSGLGTFVPVYAMFERPENALINAYVNRAHNDAIELWLETGVVGLGLMGIFVIWLGHTSLKLWRSNVDGTRELDLSLARAATIVAALIIAHSFVDYPLRTGAMMAIMAFACGLLIEPPTGIEGEASSVSHQNVWERGSRGGAPVVRPTTISSPPQSTSGCPDLGTPPPRAAGEQWGQDIEWPEEWRKQPKTRSPDVAAKAPRST